MLFYDDISSAVSGAGTRQKPLLSRFSLCIFMLFSMLLLSACGNDSDENQTAELADINGTVFKGPTSGATVTVFDEEGVQLGRGITNSNGRYSIHFDRDYQGPVRIEALGGSYVDEASGEAKTLGEAIQAVALIKNSQQTLNITPITHMAAKYLEAKGDLNAEMIEESNRVTADAFGFDGDIVEITPLNLTDVTNRNVSGFNVDYALVIAGLTQIVQKNIVENNEAGDSIEEVLAQFITDLIDNNQLNNTALLLQLNQGVNDFIASENNQAQISKEDTNTDSTFFRLKAQQNFGFDQAEFNKTLADQGFKAALQTGSGTGAIHFNSSDTNVATIDASTGDVSIIGSGETTITAQKAADSVYLQEARSYTLLVVKAPQAELFFPLKESTVRKSYAGRDFTIAAEGGSSGAAIEYSSSNANIASINAQSGRIEILAVGVVDITASKAADAFYAAASASFRLEIGKSTQGLFFDTDEVNHSYGGAPFSNTLHHIANNGEPTYSSADTNVVTVNPSTGVVSIVGVGNTTVSAHKAANENYLATSTSFTINIAKAVQQPLLFETSEAQNKVFGDANFTNAASGGTGLGAISYASNDTSVATVDANTGTVSILAVGSAIITASKAGDAHYLPQSTQSVINVGKATQAPLVFQSAVEVLKTFGDDSFNNALTGGSGSGALSYRSSDTSVATINAESGLITIVGAGSVVISAIKAADAEYIEASSQFILNVAKAAQTALNFPSILGEPVINTYGNKPFTLSATGGTTDAPIIYSSSNPNIASVDANSGQVNILGAGNVEITASKAGDAFYTHVSVSYDLQINKSTQGFYFDFNDINHSFSDAPFSNTLHYNAENGEPTYSSADTNVVTVNPSTGVVTIVGVGSTTVSALMPATENYLAGTSSFTINIAKALQAPLVFDTAAPQNKVFGDANFTNTASGGTGVGIISYASNDTRVATVDANTGTVSILAVGPAIITASKAGDNNYLAQTTLSLVNVAKAAQTPLVFQTAGEVVKTFGDVSFNNGLTGGAGDGALSYLSSDINVATVNPDTGLITIVGAGSATITASKAANANYLQATSQFTLSVEKAAQAALNHGQPDILNHSYNGMPIISHTSGGSGSGELSASASTPVVDAWIAEGSGLALEVLSVGSSIVTLTKAGDDNYLEAQASFTINVSKGSQTLSFADTGPVIKSHKDNAAFTNALSATGSGAEVYSSQDTSVATVNSSTGAVTVVGLGSTTINVNKASDALYLAANGSFELDVKVFVEPLYSNASNWNGYVKNDGADVYSATNTACDGTETGGYTKCIHGGEKRVLEVVGYSSCNFLSARDSLNALRWQCDGSTNPVRFVSVGLQQDKHLSDLLDFDSGAWLNNKVFVDYQDGTVLTTHENAWWGNPVVIDNDGGNLDSPGTIYLVNEDTSASYEVNESNIGFAVKPGKVLSHDGRLSRLLSINATSFAWVEGSMFIATNQTIINLNNSNFSVLRNLHTRANDIRHLGILLRNADNNRLSSIAISGGFTGIELDFYSTYNTLSGIVLQDVNYSALSVSQRNFLVDVLAVASNDNVISLGSAKDVFLANVTIGHASGRQTIYSDLANNLMISGLLVAGNSASRSVLELFGAQKNTLTDLAFDHVHNVSKVIELTFAEDNYFTGELRFGANPANPCFNEGPTVAGLETLSCANNGRSDATLTQPIDLTNSFVGPVLIDDVRNASDSNGSASFDSTVDWFNFDTPYRTWSKDQTFLSSLATGRWNSGQGRITDWSLSSGDNQVRGVRAVPANGNAANTITHTWSDNSTSTFLRNAVELLDDGIGNDNGMCESNEACMYTPNIGAYQGHGGKTQMTWSDGDTLTGITLYGYFSNGYASLID